MAVSIRLRREGAKNRPYYKVVVADSRSPRDGKFIEIIGTYDPKKPDHNSTLKLDRIDHWISKGAQPSDTVRSLIKKNRTQSQGAPAEDTAAIAPVEEASAPAEQPPAASVAEEPAPANEAPVAPAAEEVLPAEAPAAPAATPE
jgi:small subunit ribosomal protein S16